MIRPRIKYKIIYALIFSLTSNTALCNAKTHILARGETLESVAAKYGMTKQRLIELNPDASSFSYIGMELEVEDGIRPSKDVLKDTGSTIQQKKLNDNSNYILQSILTEPEISNSNTNSDIVTPQSIEHSTHSIFEYSINIGWQCNISGTGGDFKSRSAYGLFYDFIYETSPNAGFGLYYSMYANYGLVDKEFAGLSLCLGPSLGISFNDSKTAGIIIPAGVGYSFGNVVYFSAAPHLAFSCGHLRVNFGIIFNTDFGKFNSTSAFVSLGL